MADNNNDSQNQGIIHPKLNNDINDVRAILARQEEEYLKATPARKLEMFMLAADDVLEVQENFIMLNGDLSMNQLMEIPSRK